MPVIADRPVSRVRNTDRLLDDLVVVGPILKALGYSAGSAASFTMSIQQPAKPAAETDEWNDCEFHQCPGGARRDRTDDLKLAKLALSQLSYGPLGNESSGRPGQI